MYAGDVVISLKHPFTVKKGTVMSAKRNYGSPDTYDIAWDDGTFSSVWFSDVKVIIEAKR